MQRVQEVHGKVVYSIAFNHVDPKAGMLCATVGANYVTVYAVLEPAEYVEDSQDATIDESTESVIEPRSEQQISGSDEASSRQEGATGQDATNGIAGSSKEMGESLGQENGGNEVEEGSRAEDCSQHSSTGPAASEPPQRKRQRSRQKQKKKSKVKASRPPNVVQMQVWSTGVHACTGVCMRHEWPVFLIHVH
eukprot:3010078-Pleurochrysis_carterae.AAC.5